MVHQGVDRQDAASIQTAPIKQGLLVHGRFGNGLDVQGAFYSAEGKAVYQDPPLTVECWAKLRSSIGSNMLVVNSSVQSPRHWEIYSQAQTGVFAAFLPGATPDHIDTSIRVTDNQWHHVAMVYLPARVRLYVDGKLGADQPIGVAHATAAIGALSIGNDPLRNLHCDGEIDEVRISTTAREINEIPAEPFANDADTVGLWHLDEIVDGRFPDASKLRNSLLLEQQVLEAPKARVEFVPIPKVRARDSVDWANVGEDKGAMRYSRLSQINRKSVKNLKVAWVFHTGDAAKAGSTIECTPIVIDGVMYLTTVNLKVIALDAATGKPIWEYDPHARGVNRGLGYWSDGKPNGVRRIIAALADGKLVSLDATTGKPDPGFGHDGTVNLREGIERDISKETYGSTSAPAIFENLIIVPIIVAESQPGGPGDIRAFDVRTGQQVWRFHTAPWLGEYGNDTWAADSWRGRTGVNAWAGYTLDVKHGIVFAGLGSASSDFYGADRLGQNLFANCTLALDARTGKRLWDFQTTHHDLWDHDLPCPPVVCSIVVKGKRVEVVAQPTKTGFIFVFDRLTGKPIFGVKEIPAAPSTIPGEAPWPTQPIPLKPDALEPQNVTEEDFTNITPEANAYVKRIAKSLMFGVRYQTPSLQGTVITPGFHGGVNWSGASYDPTTNMLYVNTNNVPYISRLKPNGSGGYDFMGYTYFSDQNGYPAVKPPWGHLTAINLGTGEFAWRIVFGEFPELTAKGIPLTGTQNFGGTIVTAGGLVFIGGTMDEKFHAYDKATGKLLWDYKLDAGGYATPCTYMVNGRQYVVIAAGGGGKLGTKSGDEFVAFALPKAERAK